MADFTNSKTAEGFSLKLWRGERMSLIGMDVEEPEDDFVGFSIEVQSPNSKGVLPLQNRLAFGPRVHFCLPPHQSADLSLSPVGAAIDQATWSVFFCIAFLNLATSGAVREAVDRLQSVFRYGISVLAALGADDGWRAALNTS